MFGWGAPIRAQSSAASETEMEIDRLGPKAAAMFLMSLNFPPEFPKYDSRFPPDDKVPLEIFPIFTLR